MIRTAIQAHRATSVRISCSNGNVAELLLYAKRGFEPFAIEERLAPARPRVALVHMRLIDVTMRQYREAITTSRETP